MKIAGKEKLIEFIQESGKSSKEFMGIYKSKIESLNVENETLKINKEELKKHIGGVF